MVKLCCAKVQAWSSRSKRKYKFSNATEHPLKLIALAIVQSVSQQSMYRNRIFILVHVHAVGDWHREL